MKHYIQHAALLVLTLVLFVPSGVQAQSPQGKEALQLFEHGKKLFKQGKAKQACAAFKQSLDLEEAINTHYQLGRCYEEQDRYLEAHASYLRASTMARTNDDEKRASIAQQRADALKPKIPQIVVVVPPDEMVAGLSIAHNGEPLPEAEWGKAMAVDPGEHTLEASAPGYQTYSTTVRASRTGGVTKVAIPELEQGTGAMAAPPPPPPPPPPGEDAPYTGPTERRSTGMFVTGVVLVPLGGVSLIGAPIAAVAIALEGRADDARNAGVALALFGVAAIGAGIPLLIIGNQDVPVEPEQPEPPEPEAALYVGPTSASFSMTF